MAMEIGDRIQITIENKRWRGKIAKIISISKNGREFSVETELCKEKLLLFGNEFFLVGKNGL